MTMPFNASMIRELGAFLKLKNEGIVHLPDCHIELSGSASSITLPSSGTFPQDFKHLLIIAQMRTDRSGSTDAWSWQANGDTGNNYDTTRALFNTAAINSASSRAAASAYGGLAESASSRADNFAPSMILFPAYSRDDMEKWSLAFGARFYATAADADLSILLRVGRWRNTDPITALTIIPDTGPNFVSGCVVDGYGIY